MIQRLPLMFAVAPLLAYAAPTAPAASPERTAWFVGQLEGRAPEFPGDRTLTAPEVAKADESLWCDYKAAAVKLGWDKDLPEAMTIDMQDVVAKSRAGGRGLVLPDLRTGMMPAAAETMPYLFLARGKRPPNGYPLFIQMHGGGNTGDKLEHPHAWSVNTRDWKNQVPVCLFKFPEGLYFIPRMANDNKGRWWMKHNHAAFDTVLRRAVLFRDADPNRLYLTGISEGAYGTEALTPFWADRLAGGCAMAGGAGGGERFYNLRNTAFRNDTGENDTMFDRRKLAQQAHDYLENLKKSDPKGYDHFLNIQAGMGHGVDYAPGPAWIATKVRDPRPAKVCWFNFALDGVRRTDFSWLSLAQAPDRDVLIVAEIDRSQNTVNIVAKITPEGVKDESPVYATSTPSPVDKREPYAGNTLTVHLDDKLLDLDRPVTVVVNGKSVFSGRAERRLANMAGDLARHGDPGRVFPARIVVKL